MYQGAPLGLRDAPGWGIGCECSRRPPEGLQLPAQSERSAHLQMASPGSRVPSRMPPLLWDPREPLPAGPQEEEGLGWPCRRSQAPSPCFSSGPQ